MQEPSTIVSLYSIYYLANFALVLRMCGRSRVSPPSSYSQYTSTVPSFLVRSRNWVMRLQYRDGCELSLELEK